MWLAAYRDGGPRHRLGDNPGRDRGRTRVALPPAMFMRERLVGIGGEKFDKRVLHSLCGNQPAADAFDIFGHVIVGSKLKLTSPIIGLLKITSDECVSYEGPATKWHQESAVQMACYHHPLDAYDVRVLDVKPLHVPYYVDYRVSSTDGHGNLTNVSTTHPFVFLHIGRYTMLEQSNCDAVLSSDRLGATLNHTIASLLACCCARGTSKDLPTTSLCWRCLFPSRCWWCLVSGMILPYLLGGIETSLLLAGLPCGEWWLDLSAFVGP